MKTIGIDARFYGSIGKGLGRYTQKLIENLEEIDHENQYVVFLRKENFEQYVPKNKNFQKVLADFQWYSFAEQIRFPLLLKKENVDLMHFPHFNVPLLYRKPFVLTVHDLILLHFPTLRGTTLHPFFYWTKYAAYKLTIGSAIRRAKTIFAVSNFTKKDIIANYPAAKNKITVTYEACETALPKESFCGEEILKKYGIIKPYLLYVGNAYPHKNLERLLSAFGVVKSQFGDIELVLVGKEDYFYGRLKEKAKKEKQSGIIFAGFVPDGELDCLYRQAQLYVFPSLYEGFGLPPLEAMANGLPVISSDHECMREILEDAAYFVDCKKVENLARGIVEVLENEKTKDELREKGFLQIRKFSWKGMAEKTLEEYKNINE